LKSEQPTQPIALETAHLSRAVVGKVLTDDINVQVQVGEVVAVVGPSGSGKSSFLRLLNRLDEPTGGSVRLNGEDYRRLAPQELRRRVSTDALLHRVGLSGYQERNANNLSGGEAQRVSIARTLANAPEILLLDEPTSALDEDSARGVEDLVLDIIRERRMTCVIVTHNNAQARRIAHRTMIIQDGKLVAIGPTDEVLRDD